MVLIIIIKAVTRMAVMIMMSMIPVMRKEEEVEVGKRSPFQEEGTSKMGFEDREGYKRSERIFPKLGRGMKEDSTSKDTDINFGTHSLPSIC